jgi:hypothetical protein
MNASIHPNTAPTEAEEPCLIPRWYQDSPQREIEIIRTALARHRALLHQAHKAEEAARQVLVEACRTLGPGTAREASAQCLEERLIEAEIAVAEGGVR